MTSYYHSLCNTYLSSTGNRDTLLLELGFLVIFVAPLRLPFVDLPQLTKHCKNVSFWLVRWMTFRLMFSSGVVKLNSQCPTWWGLTGEMVNFLYFADTCLMYPNRCKGSTICIASLPSGDC